jgi:hypothetical protein
MSMTLRVETVPPVVFAVLDAGPQRAAINGEVPSVSVVLDNARGEAAARLAVPPLRARAQLLLDGVAVFVGSVQAVTLAEVATLALEG